MDNKKARGILLEKENDHKNVNKRIGESLNKFENRLPISKKITSLEDK
jgi:hypothetical protein